jgi:hypothetical protein
VETVLARNKISRENRPQQLEIFSNSEKPFIRAGKMGEQNPGL